MVVPSTTMTIWRRGGGSETPSQLSELDVVLLEDALDRAVLVHFPEAAVEALHRGFGAGHGAAQAEIIGIAADFLVGDRGRARVGRDEVLGRRFIAIEQV